MCKEATHNTIDCNLNAKNHRVVYKIEVIPNDQGQWTNFRSNDYNLRGGNNGQGRYNCWGGYNNQGWYQNNFGRRPGCWVCYKYNHLSAECPYKDRIDLKYYNTCGVGDHSLDDCPIMHENIINKKSINILLFVPKRDVHSVKNLQIIIQCGIRTGYDKDTIEPINNIDKKDYPNSKKKKDLFINT